MNALAWLVSLGLSAVLLTGVVLGAMKAIGVPPSSPIWNSWWWMLVVVLLSVWASSLVAIARAK